MAAVHGIRITLSDQTGFTESYDATEITANTFALVGQRPIVGRDFTAADQRPGAAPVAILSYGFWERRYGGDTGIIGQAVRMNGVPTTVVGVMPDGFLFPQHQDLWVPLVPTPEVRKREARNLWFAFGRLTDQATVEGARAEIDTIARRLARAYPRTNGSRPPIVQTFDDFFVGPSARLIYGALWGAVGFVLLIACANLANLMLARAIGRSRETSVRIALGAGRWRIVRQLLIESLMLSAAGGMVGWWMARWGIRVYALADRSWRILDYTMDGRVMAYLVAISIGAGLLFGVAPALRLSTFDVSTALKDGGRGASGGGRKKRLSSILVVAEMALAVVLLAGAGVMVRSFLKIYTADAGIDPANVLAVLMGLPDARYHQADAQISFVEQLDARVAAIPGVESVAIGSAMPTSRLQGTPYELAGAPPVDEQRRPTVSVLSIEPAYFETLGAAIRGRAFNAFDGASGMPVAIVNQRFASHAWPGESALGKRLRLFQGTTPGAWLTVTGVVSNILQSSATLQAFDPVVYLPYRQAPTRALWVFARTRVAPGSLVPAVRREVQALDADLPTGAANLWTLADWLEWPHREQDNLTVLFLFFAAIALLLASVGLYAVVAHSVSLRTQEIGIRIAIGATTRDILALVLRQGVLPLGAGLGIGAAASLAVTPLLKSQLVQVSPGDPIALGAASAVLVVSAALGCVIPARRAMRVDPVVALRHD
jgi:predicted permease